MGDTDLVLAITADDTMFHVGTPSWLVDHLFSQGASATALLALHDAVEVYDAAGRALAVQRDPTGRPTGLAPTGVGDADPDLLVARVDAVLAKAREHLRAHPEESATPDLIPGASGPLPGVLAMLDAYGSGPAPGTRPTWRGPLRRWVDVAWESVRSRVPWAAARSPVGDPGTAPVLDDSGIPHDGSWFHNLMHRLRG